MKKTVIPILVALALPIQTALAERPLLLTDINPSQLYTKQQVNLEVAQAEQKQYSQLSVLQQEYLTLTKIQNLDIKKLSKSDLDFLGDASRYKSQAFIKHEEGPLPLVIFDIASAAKFQISQYQVLQETNQLELLKVNNWASFLQRMVTDDDLFSKNLLTAKLNLIEQLSVAQSYELAKTLTKKRTFDDPLVLKVIMGSRDFELTNELLTNSKQLGVHRILEEAIQSFSDYQQAAIFESVVGKNDYLASQALIKYAQLPNAVRNDDWLLSRLTDSKHGGSAAKAIALSNSSELLVQAAELVSQPQATRLQVANALLTLKFANNDFANQTLQALLDNRQIAYTDMQLEVSKWLD